jgi:RNA polymerase sigma-70 factor (ECF subfamily)
MSAVAKGDRAAFTQLVERHLNLVHQFALRSSNQPADADEMAQESFLRLWQKASSYHPGRVKFTTWLLQITRNQCIDLARRNASRPSSQQSQELPSTSDTLPAQLDRTRELERLRAAIADLPERQRSALTLCQLQGRSNPEAAQILGVSVDAVESLLARARRTLKGRLST